jgi:hypothetical protein
MFNGMAQFYKCFIRNFASIMAPIIKLLKKTKVCEWTTKCQTIWEDIKNWYIQVPILINPNWELENVFLNLLTYYEQDMAKSIIFYYYYNNV